MAKIESIIADELIAACISLFMEGVVKAYKLAVITGSIGCGKSSVCKILADKGYEIIDADKLAKETLKDKASDIARIFGKEYMMGDIVDTKKLGALVFADKEARIRLEELTHPAIREKIYAEIETKKSTNKLFFVDIPLFFESAAYKDLSPVVVVYATRDECIKRATARDGAKEEATTKRLEAQIDIDKKKDMADFVIDNSGGYDELQGEVDKFLERVEK